jgi:mono/diheme cytochrome c family protein
MGRFLSGAFFAIGAAAAAGLGIVFLGLAPVNADQPPSAIEAQLLGIALRKAVARQALTETSEPPSTEDLANGREIYQEMCARCHGDPGKARNRLAPSFYPPAPQLPGQRSEWSEQQLFWIIKHGIRNTAMPAWGSALSDEDIRQVAALVKHFGTRRFHRPPAEIGY